MRWLWSTARLLLALAILGIALTFEGVAAGMHYISVKLEDLANWVH